MPQLFRLRDHCELKNRVSRRHCQAVTRYLRKLPPTGAFTFGVVSEFVFAAAPVGCIVRRGATHLAALLHPLLSLPVQGPPFIHLSLVPISTLASSKLPSGLCVGSSAPWTSTLPAESITTSEDRARAVRAATTDVAAPTASAAFSNSPRRLTPGSPSLLGSLDTAHPRLGHIFRVVKIAHRFKPQPAGRHAICVNCHRQAHSLLES
jgi:hypothetical protein